MGIGADGIEPSTSCSQNRRATAALRPEAVRLNTMESTVRLRLNCSVVFHVAYSTPGATRTPAPSSGGWCSIRLSYGGAQVLYQRHFTVATKATVTPQIPAQAMYLMQHPGLYPRP